LRVLAAVALIEGAAPVYGLGLPTDQLRTTFDAGFAILWLVGILCAPAAAYQAKFHRLAL
jgi:multicomponent K+:H+ antiporter subunit A